MDNFSFMGREIFSFGAEVAFGKSMRIGAKVKRSEYSLPDGGSVIIGEDSYQTTQRQVSILPLPGVEASPVWRRRILAWLQSGRGEMIVHNDPDVIRIAQFDQDGTWGMQEWPDGEIQLTMTLQPLAYAARATVHTSQSVSGAAQLLIAADSALPMPLEILCEATSGTVTGLELTCGKARLALDGMSLTPGQKVRYDAGSLIGDVMSLTIADALGFGLVTQWSKLTAMPGDVLTATVEGGEICLTAICRGRWPT